MSHRRAISISYGFQTVHRVCSSSAKTSIPSPFLEERHGYCYIQKFFLLNVKLKWLKDRALDHVVERERDSKSVVALKDIVKKQPGACLPVDAVSKKNRELGLKIRVSRFLRKYPSIFEEYAAEKTNLPWFRLSKEALALEEEEERIHRQKESDNADKLCKLLMLTRPKQLHLDLIDELKWDLGLPDNYIQSLVPNYPDYFSIVNMSDNRPGLDLVCWNNELAVSTLEKRAANVGKYRKGMALAFPMNFSKGHEMKQKVVKWLQDWQKLPYISPYEDVSHLDPNSDLGEKRVVGILHELLCLMVHKKAHRRTLLRLREPMGLPHKFVRCFSRHPGIFYESKKNGVITVVLREAFKRAELVDAHPLVTLRGKYIHLMVKGMEDRKKGLYKKGRSQQKDSVDGDKDHPQQKSDDCDKPAHENKESQEEESSDDSKYYLKHFSEDETETETEIESESESETEDDDDEIEYDDDDEEDEEDDDDEEDEDDDDEEEIGRAVRTSGKQSRSFMSSSRQATSVQSPGSRGSNSKTPGIKDGSLRTSKWQDRRERTSGGQGSSFETSGRRNSKLQTSDRAGSNFETSGNPGRKFNSRTYRMKNDSFRTSKWEDSSKRASGRQDSSFEFETSGRRNSKLQTSDSRGSHFETSGNPGRKFNSRTYGMKDGSLRTSKWEDSSKQTPGRQGSRFEASGRQNSKLKTPDRQGSHFETSGNPGSKFNSITYGIKDGKCEDSSKQTSGRQGSGFEASGRRNSKFQAYGRQGSDFKTSGNPDSKFNSKTSEIKDGSLRTSKRQDSSKLTTGRQGSSFEASGRQNSKSHTSGRRGTESERSANPGSQFEASGKRGKKFEMSGNRDSRFK